MQMPVSIQRCADYLAVDAKQIRALITLGLVTATDHKVVPHDVFAALMDAGLTRRCPCCGADADSRVVLPTAPPDEES